MKKFYQNPLIAIFFSFCVIALGLKSFFDLPIALYPDTSQPVIVVQLEFNNISMEDFRQKYGKKIEASLSSVENIEFIETSYYKNRARWLVHFSWEVDGKKAKLDVQSAISSVSQSFPESWGGFRVHPENGQNGNVYVALYSETYSRKELFELLEDRVLNNLKSIKGMERAGFWLPMEDYIKIELKPSLLDARGISPHHIKEALAQKKYDKKLGRLKTKNNHYEVLIPLRDNSLSEIRKTIILSKEGKSFRLEDFAEVSIETKHFDNLMKSDGKKSLIAAAEVKPSGNISYVCTEFLERLEKAKTEISSDISMSVLLDPSEFIEDAIANILLAIFLGILIATLIIFLFLNSFSHTFVVAFSIPLSVIGGFSLMALLGIEINLISLGALALSVGMVVDGAIVVLENIARYFELEKPKTRKDRIHLVIKGVGEVKSAVIASLLTTIIVFAPLAFTAPLANAILGDLARVMVCVLVISVLVTLYIVPPLLVFLNPSSLKKKRSGVYYLSHKFSGFMTALQRMYVKALKLLIRNSWASRIFFAGIFVVFALSLFVLKNSVKREILALPDSDKVWLIANWAEGQLELEEGNKLVTEQMERVLEEEFSSYIKHFFTQIRSNSANILCTLKDKSMLKEFKRKMEERFKNSARIRYFLDVWNPTALSIPKEALFKIMVSGSDPKKKRETLKSLEEIFSASEAIGQIRARPNPRKSTYYELNLDEEKIKRLEEKTHVPLSKMITSSIESSFGDAFVQSLALGNKDYSIRMGYPKGLVTSIEDFKNLLFKVEDDYYPLRNFAYVKEKKSNLEIFVKDSSEIYRIEVWAKQSFKGSKEDLKKELLVKLKSQADFDFKTLSFAETGKEINESLFSLLNAFLLALTLIVAVLVLQFGSFKQTFIIMLAVPLGIIGVSFSLYLFSSTLSVNSMLGLILLSGTAVNNSILLLDFFNNIYKSSSLQELETSLLQAANLRLRPILITTLTTILGMIPIAFAFGSGGEVLQPLGIAVCGGLGVSTIFTLFVIPLVLYKVEGRKWA